MLININKKKFKKHTLYVMGWVLQVLIGWGSPKSTYNAEKIEMGWQKKTKMELQLPGLSCSFVWTLVSMCSLAGDGS